MTRFLISCHSADAPAMAVLLEGMNAHAECDAFPMWIDDEDMPPLMLKLLPHLKTLQHTWIATLEDLDSLETMVKLMESVPWAFEQSVIMARDDAGKHWTLEEFHKAVFVDGEFLE